MIVWLASAARSGNTMYRMLLHYLTGVHTYSAHGNDPYFSKETTIGSVIGHRDLPTFNWQRLARDREVYFVKTHARGNHHWVADVPAKVVLIVRDGRDVKMSQARWWAHRHGGQDWRVRLRFMVLKAKLQWQDHVLSWLDRADAVVRYEDMVERPVETVRESVNALDLGLQARHSSFPSFQELHRRWPSFFRKGKAGGWRKDMPKRLERIWWGKNAEGMRALGYDR